MEFVIRASAESTGGAEHIFTVGDQTFEVSPGGLVFGPRGVPHPQRHPDGGRTLTLPSPTGFEQFFRDITAAEHAGESDFEDVQWIAEAHGARFVT